MEETKYVSPFTEETVTEISTFIHKAIADHCVANDVKLDIYAVIAGLNKVAYEVILRSSAKNQDEAIVMVDKMKEVAAHISKSLDERRVEKNDGGTFEILGAIFASSIVAEFYSKLRDERVQLAQKLQDEATEMSEGQDVAETVQDEA